MKKEIISFLLDLKRCGEFYHSAIEIDSHCDDPISGDEFKERLDDILKSIAR